MNGYIGKMIMKDGREQPYVFITGEDNKQYFLHKTNYLGEWYELSGIVASNTKTYVTFDVEQSPKGERAANCMLSSK